MLSLEKPWAQRELKELDDVLAVYSQFVEPLKGADVPLPLQPRAVSTG